MFKIGDKVICVDVGCNEYIKIGDIYTVSSFDKFSGKYYFSELSFGYHSHHFNLLIPIQHQPTVPQWGLLNRIEQDLNNIK